ncbi:hypothetical protein HN859_05610 [Candidatus Parcubacteria bacterium]|jgi:hypothetical protein|nr:hypothetical protein [Candidatus Parcubacteria bacterium]
MPKKPPLHELLIKMFTGSDQVVMAEFQNLNADKYESPTMAAWLMANGHIPDDAKPQCVETLLQPPHYTDEDVSKIIAKALIVLDGVAQLKAKLEEKGLNEDHSTYLRTVQDKIDELIALTEG